MQTPLLPFYSSNDDPVLPFTDWMLLPDAHKVRVLGYFASELEDDAVPVQVVAQFSNDGGYSDAGANQAIGTALALKTDQWMSDPATLDLDSYMDGYTHVRLGLKCTTVTGDTVIPFRCAIIFDIEARTVARIPLDASRFLVWNNLTYRNYRLTPPIDLAAAGSGDWKARAIVSVQQRAVQTTDTDDTGEFKIKSFKSMNPLDPTGWTASNQFSLFGIDDDPFQTHITDTADLDDFDEIALAFGAGVARDLTDSSGEHGAMALAGTIELWK